MSDYIGWPKVSDYVGWPKLPEIPSAPPPKTLLSRFPLVFGGVAPAPVDPSSALAGLIKKALGVTPAGLQGLPDLPGLSALPGIGDFLQLMARRSQRARSTLMSSMSSSKPTTFHPTRQQTSQERAAGSANRAR